MEPEIFTLDQHPEYVEKLEPISRDAWPEFLRHGNSTNWELLFSAFAKYQILMCDAQGELMAV